MVSNRSAHELTLSDVIKDNGMEGADDAKSVISHTSQYTVFQGHRTKAMDEATAVRIIRAVAGMVKEAMVGRTVADTIAAAVLSKCWEETQGALLRGNTRVPFGGRLVAAPDIPEEWSLETTGKTLMEVLGEAIDTLAYLHFPKVTRPRKSSIAPGTAHRGLWYRLFWTGEVFTTLCATVRGMQESHTIPPSLVFEIVSYSPTEPAVQGIPKWIIPSTTEASRSLAPGTIVSVYSTDPGATGPRNGSQPVTLSCHRYRGNDCKDKELWMTTVNPMVS